MKDVIAKFDPATLIGPAISVLILGAGGLVAWGNLSARMQGVEQDATKLELRIDRMETLASDRSADIAVVKSELREVNKKLDELLHKGRP